MSFASSNRNDTTKRPFDLERLRSWTKEEIIEWIEDGQYVKLVYSPQLDQPDLEGKRRVILIRPENRADRQRKMRKMIPAPEWHAVQEMQAAFRRLKGHRNPKDPRSLLFEMMDYADPSLLDLYTDVLEKRLGKHR